MEEYFNGLLKEVDQRMATTAPGMDGKEVIGVCREMVSYLKGKNRELKEYALAHPFAGDAKEILYFKYYKPALTGRLLYYYRVYQIESGCPACLRVAEPYYRKAMERAERMMERYLPFYQYYHSGATYRSMLCTMAVNRSLLDIPVRQYTCRYSGIRSRPARRSSRPVFLWSCCSLCSVS